MDAATSGGAVSGRRARRTASGTRSRQATDRARRVGRVLPRLGRWVVRGVLLLFLLLFVVTLFGDRVAFGPGNTGRADVATPYLEEVAADLAADRVYLDPALASIPAAEGVASRRLLAGRPDDLYVAVLPLEYGDGNGGRLDLTGRRLQHLVDRDGVYVVVDQQGQCTGLRFSGGTEAQQECDTRFSAAELDRLIVDTGSPDRWYDPWLAGVWAVLAGLGACLLLGWLLRGLALLRDRPTTYLPGLDRRRKPTAGRRLR